MIADYHIHTHMCRHAEGEPREYVERAVELGMTEMGFADHLPFLGGWEPRHDLIDDWAMRIDELDD
jgi:histidinol-phosphatase (PHP family)